MPPLLNQTIALLGVLALLACPAYASGQGFVPDEKGAPSAEGPAVHYGRPVDEPALPPQSPVMPAAAQADPRDPAGFPRESAAAAPRPLPPAATGAAIPVGKSRREPPLPFNSSRAKSESAKPLGGLPSVVTTAGSLALVLGIFFLVAWMMRRATPRSSIVLPGEVFEVLGRAALVGRQQVYLLRCGQKLLLVSLTPAGAETLTEVTDPQEVDRLAGLCRQAHPQSATAAFRQVFQQFASPGAARTPGGRRGREEESGGGVIN